MIRSLFNRLYRPKAHFVFGQGKLLVQTGTCDGKPIIILTHPEHEGVYGEDAAGKERSAMHPDVMRRSVVLEFPSESHRDAVHRSMFSRDLL
jgi:hypothetical protein